MAGIALAGFFAAPFDLNLNASQALAGRRTETLQLSNGLKVIYERNDASNITVCQILVFGGKKAEPPGKEGLSYMTARLTLEFPDFRTLQIMMDQATELNAAGRMDHSQIGIACLSENFGETIKQVSQIFLEPLFSSIRIDSAKKFMIRIKDLQDEEPLEIAGQSALDSFFAGTAYSGSAYGTEESLKAIKKKDIDTFYENFFRSDNMVVAVVSDLSRSEIQEVLEKYLLQVPPGPTKKIDADFSARIPGDRQLSIKKDTKQTLILAAYPLPGISRRNYIFSHFLYTLIGQGPNSLLWPLRLEKKLAYNVNTRLDLFSEGGVLEAYLETDNEKTEMARQAIQEVLSDLFERGMTEEELETTKSYYRGTLLRESESKADRAQAIIDLEALGLGHEFLGLIFDEIETVTLEEINGFIKTTLDPKKRLDIVVGPLGSF